MERKRSLIVAGAVSGTLLAASTAYALTGGLLDRPADDGAGTLAPVTAMIGGSPTTAVTSPAPPGRLPDDERAELEEVREHVGGGPGYRYEGADDDD